MDDFRFTTELDDQNRISVPDDLARKIPPHTKLDVRLHVEPSPRMHKSNGALDYYMEHGIDMPGILPFDRNSLYSDTI
jgi:hypothetical protein